MPQGDPRWCEKCGGHFIGGCKCESSFVVHAPTHGPPACSACRFSAISNDSDDREDGALDCRRLPPARPHEGLRYARFPVVRPEFWCGEFLL